jgi:iron complex transport system substrate-binding protein
MCVFMRLIAVGCAAGVLSVFAASGDSRPPATGSAPHSTANARIVSLAPSLTELVFAAGAGAKLIGVSAYSDYPEAARQVPVVADFAGVNLEALIALKPDLVLAWGSGTRPQDIERMRGLRIRVEVVSVERLQDLVPAILRIGELAGTQAQAAATADALSKRISALARSRATPVPTLMVISTTPLMTVNRMHFLGDVVERCGGRNVFADAPTLVLQPSREALIERNPALIIHGASARQSADDDIRRRQAFAGTLAARNAEIRAVNSDWLMRPGPRLVDAAEAVCRLIDAAAAHP